MAAMKGETEVSALFELSKVKDLTQTTALRAN